MTRRSRPEDGCRSARCDSKFSLDEIGFAGAECSCLQISLLRPAGDLAMEAWEWSRMGAEVTNARSVLDQIEDMEVSDTVKAGLQRDLRLLADGISPSSWHRKKRLTDFINGFGVSADALAGLAPSNGSPISERLDLSTGQATTTIALSTMGSGT